jgi:hypothetical protein
VACRVPSWKRSGRFFFERRGDIHLGGSAVRTQSNNRFERSRFWYLEADSGDWLLGVDTGHRPVVGPEADIRSATISARNSEPQEFLHATALDPPSVAKLSHEFLHPR